MERFAKFDYSQKSNLDFFSPQLFGINRISAPVAFVNDDVYKISVRLNNAYKRFISLASERYKFSFRDYCRLHCRVWSCYYADILRLHLCNPDIPLNEKYDNLQEIKDKYDDSHIICTQVLDKKLLPKDFEPVKKMPYILPIGFSEDMLVVTNPNEFLSVQMRTKMFRDSYHEHIKHRSVSNSILSDLYEEF